MNAPAPEKKNEEGGMLVAALAGGAILLAVALVMFSGGDEADDKSGDGAVAAANEASGKAGAGSPSAFKARKVDDAVREGRENKPQPAVDPNSGPHRTTRMVAGGGMQASPEVKGPPEFKSKEEERDWWQRQLDGAQMLKQRRERAIAKLPEMEAEISEAANPEQARKSFEKKRTALEEALQRSDEKIAEIEAKLSEL